jgi:hypothetical protein
MKELWKKEHRGYRIAGKRSKCWIWQGASHKGYGHCDSNSHLGEQSVHRWMYKKHKGPIPKGYEVDHLCGIRLCGRPVHLEAVTKLKNTQRRDRDRPYARSVAGSMACRKLSDFEAASIRKIRKTSNLSYSKIATMFDVCAMTIFKVCKKHTYKTKKRKV